MVFYLRVKDRSPLSCQLSRRLKHGTSKARNFNGAQFWWQNKTTVEACTENFFRYGRSSARSAQVRRGFFLVVKPGRLAHVRRRSSGIPLWKAATQVTTAHFQNTAGISVAPVVDRKSARVCITDKMSGFKMSIFKMVVEHGVHVFKVEEKAELPGMSEEELHQLVAAASAAKRSVVVLFFPSLCSSPLLRRRGVGAPASLAELRHPFVVSLALISSLVLRQRKASLCSGSPVSLESVLPCLMLFSTLVSNVQVPSGQDVRLAPMAVSQLIALCATLTLSLTSQASNVLSGDGKMMFCVLVTCLWKGRSLPLAVTFQRRSYGSAHGTIVVYSKTT